MVLINKPSLATARKNSSIIMNTAKRAAAKRTIVVLGVERGGTSMAAGVVRALGISMGQRAGLNHEDPLFLTDELGRLQNRIKMRNDQEDVWGFKVPKASMMLDFYEARLRNPHYIVVYRNPLAIIDSWMQRGASDPLDPMDRIMSYQNAIFDFLRKTQSPVLMLNYERAVQNKATKLETVELLSDFVGVLLTQELRDRASGMMTGDGSGYVNLPEHFFAANVAPQTAVAGTEMVMQQEREIRDADGWIRHDKAAPQLIYTPQDSEFLPRTFLLDIDFDDGGTMDLANNPLRIYFNYIGSYFPGHCARPPVHLGDNRYLVETSGNATAIAFGPLEPNVQFKLSPRFYNLVK